MSTRDGGRQTEMEEEEAGEVAHTLILEEGSDLSPRHSFKV